MALSSAIASDAGPSRAPAFVLRPGDDASALGSIASACADPVYALVSAFAGTASINKTNSVQRTESQRHIARAL